MISAPTRRRLLCERFPLTISPLIDFKAPGTDLESYKYCTEGSIAVVETFGEAFDELKGVPFQNHTNIWALVSSIVRDVAPSDTNYSFSLDSQRASYGKASVPPEHSYTFCPETNVGSPISYCSPPPNSNQMALPLAYANSNYLVGSETPYYFRNGGFDSATADFAVSPEVEGLWHNNGLFNISKGNCSLSDEKSKEPSSVLQASFSVPVETEDFVLFVRASVSAPKHASAANLVRPLWDIPEGTRFFVIKSYSAEDVEASLMHGLWTLTDLGNKRLNKAFKEVRAMGSGKVFLFFLVNGSGKFCGYCEMLQEVDFTRAVDIWVETLRWKGVFPVNWLAVKDIPNRAFSHLRVPANEYKSVANSRDTQEVPFEVGVSMVHLFLSHGAV